MAWNDRIREAAYTSPSGIRQPFIYENVTQVWDKKTEGFNFPDADGTFVQDNGRSGRRFPLRVIFSGGDHDTEAEAFDALLVERGTGTLDHPMYGTVLVVPFGAITRRDDLKTAANQTIFEVTFWETIDLVYPTAQTDPASAVLASVEEYNEAAAEELADGLSLDTAVERVTSKNQVLALVDTVKSGLQAVADITEEVQKEFDAIVDSITNGIDLLVGAPVALALQVTQMIQAPGRALASIKSKIDAYQNLITRIVSGAPGSPTSPGDEGEPALAETTNALRTADLYASSYVTGSIVSTVNNQFFSKTEALEAAQEVLAQLDAVVVWRDANFEALEEIDTGGSYQKLQEAVALTAGFLVEISFTLKTERRIVLDRDRTMIDLVAQLYGAVDSELDFFITSNDLSGSEILELPAGRRIVYYT